MTRPMLADGRLKPGPLIALLLSGIGGSIELGFLNRMLVEGAPIEKSSIINLKRYIGLIDVIKYANGETMVSLSPEGLRWLEFYAPVILTRLNKDRYIPTNYENSGWLKGKIRPIMEKFIKQHRVATEEWKLAKESGKTWSEFRKISTKYDYQIVVPVQEENPEEQVMTWPEERKYFAQPTASGLVKEGFKLELYKIPRY